MINPQLHAADRGAGLSGAVFHYNRRPLVGALGAA